MAKKKTIWVYVPNKEGKKLSDDKVFLKKLGEAGVKAHNENMDIGFICKSDEKTCKEKLMLVAPNLFTEGREWTVRFKKGDRIRKLMLDVFDTVVGEIALVVVSLVAGGLLFHAGHTAIAITLFVAMGLFYGIIL